MRNHQRFLRQLALTALAVAGVLLLLAITSRPGWTDDRDLLRFDTSKPYLFLLLDTSASMALEMGPVDAWVPGGADNPNSRIFQAKQAVHEVFKTVTDLHFGFASYNQDAVRVLQKHWLYFTASPPTVYFGGTWPITFPQPELDGALTTYIDTPIQDTDGDGVLDTGDGIPEPISDIQTGDVLTMGPHFPIGTPGLAGSCGSPLDLDDPVGRARAQSFAIQAQSSQTTRLWVEEGGQTYFLDIIDLSGVGVIGVDSPIVRHFHLTPASCTGVLGQTIHADFTLQMDSFLNEILVVDSRQSTGEAYAGLWDWSDVESQADFGTSHPFTGKGWEGNYDSGFTTGVSSFDNSVTVDDHFCLLSDDPFFCERGPKPVENTVMGVDPVTLAHEPALDSGDMIPFDWQNENRDRFLQRLAPNLVINPGALPELGVAPYYANQPVSIFKGSNTEWFHPLITAAARPLAAADTSPMAKAVNDFRCWYLGKEGRGAAGKCRQTSFYDAGWESLACQFDSEFGCRRPFLIIISDGEDTEKGEDATADVAALNSQSGIQTWAINLGDPRSCQAGGGLHPIVQSGKGTCLTVSTRAQLVDTLKDILGEIRESARSFASAAVPSVQATVEQKIFLTSFTPLNDESVWDGHVFSFLKPLPIDANSRPDTAARCDGSGSIAQRETECLAWDAGEVMALSQINTPPLGLTDQQGRRVFYARESRSGDWPNNRELLDPVDCSASPPGARCLDLLDGLGILPSPVPASLAVEEARANNVISRTLALKSAIVDEIDPVTGNPITRNIDYVLGDTFHSTPGVLGSPPSTNYFASDLFVDLGNPTAACDSVDAKGYRCFFRRHQNRRRLLVVGSDDAMLHGFDAGNFRVSGTDPITGKTLDNEFDNGLGKELFAFIPRTVLPAVRDLAEGTQHLFTVDGTPAAADVFIDPVFPPAAGPDPTEREWRTVLVTGLREGGSGYFGLDLTQPDHLNFVNGVFEPDDLGNYLPSCTTNFNATDCGPVPYPSLLWEFTDSVWDPVDGYVRLDEDANGEADLGDTWSTPNIGLIQVCKPNGTACKPNDPNPANRADIEQRFVAVVGGGMDVDSKTTPSGSLGTLTANGSALRGNWVYMIDIETGEVIYKRQVIGAVPSEIAAVDTDQNGVLDRLYFGTLAGLVYRVDLTPDSSGDLPELDNSIAPVLGLDGNVHAVAPRIEAGEWVPRVLFDTLGDVSAASATQVRRPLYLRPSVFFIAKLGLYGLSFGSGDREDLWSTSLAEGRFWVFVDDTGPLSPALTEGPLARIDLIDPDTGTDFLLDPARAPGSRGWYLALGVNERVITDAFALSGVTIFSSFVPRVEVTDANGNPVATGCSSKGKQPNEPRCSKLGNSNIFAVNTTNANALLQDTAGLKVRSVVTPTYVSNPFAETGSSKNATSGSGGTTADDLDQRLTDIMNSLKSLFPTNCKFASYRIDVKTVASDTSLNFIAPIPVCLVEKNWKDF